MKLFRDEKMCDVLLSMLEDKLIKEKYYQVLTPKDLKPIVKHLKTNQLTFVLDGEGKVVVNDEILEIKANDVVYIPKNSTHSFIAFSDELKLFHIHLPYEYIESDREVIKRDFYDE